MQVTDWFTLALCFVAIGWTVAVVRQAITQNRWSKERRNYYDQQQIHSLYGQLRGRVIIGAIDTARGSGVILICGYTRIAALAQLVGRMKRQPFGGLVLDETSLLQMPDPEAGFHHPDVERFDSLMREV